MTAARGFKYIERFSWGIQWYMLETKDTFSKISSEFKNENGDLVSSNGESISFRFSVEEV